MFQKDLLEKHLQEGNTDAAKQLIAEYFSGEVTEQERAEAYVLIAELYLTSSNRISKEFLEDTAPALKALRELDTMENDLQRQSGLLDAREALK